MARNPESIKTFGNPFASAFCRIEEREPIVGLLENVADEFWGLSLGQFFDVRTAIWWKLTSKDDGAIILNYLY